MTSVGKFWLEPSPYMWERAFSKKRREKIYLCEDGLFRGFCRSGDRFFFDDIGQESFLYEGKMLRAMLRTFARRMKADSI